MFTRVIFSVIPWVVASESASANKTRFKVSDKKRVELFQLMLIGRLNKYLRTYF